MLGTINFFQAPDEGTGTDAIVAPGLLTVSGDFSSSSNATNYHSMILIY